VPLRSINSNPNTTNAAIAAGPLAHQSHPIPNQTGNNGRHADNKTPCMAELIAGGFVRRQRRLHHHLH
jgi:hypothetical protein